MQIASSATASLLAYVVGIVIASSSVVIARLSDGEHDDTGFQITHEEASWIGKTNDKRVINLTLLKLHEGQELET